MGRIGFYQPTERKRTPIYSLSGLKLCFIEAGCITRLDGTLIARIIRYKSEPSAIENCISDCTLPPEPEQQYEV